MGNNSLHLSSLEISEIKLSDEWRQAIVRSDEDLDSIDMKTCKMTDPGGINLRVLEELKKCEIAFMKCEILRDQERDLWNVVDVYLFVHNVYSVQKFYPHT